jgi:hypothetical protein
MISLLACAGALDIQSGNVHQVKPALTNRLDFAPRIPFEGDAEFPLLGGGVDYFLDRRAAIVVYERRLHTVTLIVTRPDDSTGRVVSSRQAPEGSTCGFGRRTGWPMRWSPTSTRPSSPDSRPASAVNRIRHSRRRSRALGGPQTHGDAQPDALNVVGPSDATGTSRPPPGARSAADPTVRRRRSRSLIR